jgi:hypothetical protein
MATASMVVLPASIAPVAKSAPEPNAQGAAIFQA